MCTCGAHGVRTPVVLPENADLLFGYRCIVRRWHTLVTTAFCKGRRSRKRSHGRYSRPHACVKVSACCKAGAWPEGMFSSTETYSCNLLHFVITKEPDTAEIRTRLACKCHGWPGLWPCGLFLGMRVVIFVTTVESTQNDTGLEDF
ncbi:hypothetical protein LZ32DRAFT_378728 [Colletotrichum eremochloae]|nr:hypothetical protein LZ32DRAFT_378728 [Colletotrichum eremochloae]